MSPAGPDADDLAAWLRLLETPGVGRVTARRLLAAFGSPQDVLAAPEPQRAEVAGPAVARALSVLPAGFEQLWQATAAWLAAAEAAPRAIITLGDPLYPAALLQAPDPPLLLHVCGDPAWLQRPALAVVGSRNPTAQGAENARVFAAALSRAGLTVVSGLALGIDAAAHEGALLGEAGTIAVVGTGLDRVYPRQHRDLAHRIASHGVLISEYPLGTTALAAHFPQRNRIITGLALGTLVVEATLQSGSLISARLAVEAGREVFAIPGSIHSPQSRGCHALIRQGAKLVESTQDILEELHLAVAPSAVRSEREAGSPDADRAGRNKAAATPATLPETEPACEDVVLAALGQGAATLDALQLRTGWSVSDLTARLMMLELEGAVVRLPGQLFQRCGFG